VCGTQPADLSAMAVTDPFSSVAIDVAALKADSRLSGTNSLRDISSFSIAPGATSVSACAAKASNSAIGHLEEP
jgi:hypothetical protein